MLVASFGFRVGYPVKVYHCKELVTVCQRLKATGRGRKPGKSSAKVKSHPVRRGPFLRPSPEPEAGARASFSSWLAA